MPYAWPPAEVTQADSTPEHTKMAPFVESNWAIRDFVKWCEGRGVRLVHDGADGITRPVNATVLENLLARFRGVDPDAYKAESKMLLAKYEAVLPKLPARLKTDADALPLMEEFDKGDAQVIKIIEVLDQLRVPVDSGRIICTAALRKQGIPTPETVVLARAIRFRKAIYGVESNHKGRMHPNDPRRKVHKPRAEQVDIDQQAVSALMSKLKGQADAAQG